MPGTLVLVVGPSGAGKDTLIALARDALGAEDSFVFPRRLVTRPPSPHEDNEPIGEAEFEAGEAEGRFALSWRAHGLGYALPGSVVDALAEGRIVVCNVSRHVVAQARERFAAVAVVVVTAPPDVLAERLRRRGRAEDGDLATRLSRCVDVRADLTIENVGHPETAARDFVRYLRECR